MNTPPNNAPDSQTTARPRGRWPMRIALAIGCILLTMVVADLVVRFAGIGPPNYAPRRFEPGGGVPFARIPNGPIVYQPGARFASVYDVQRGSGSGESATAAAIGRASYSINEHGFRGASVPIQKPEGVRRVVCLGDSITFGEGVDDAATYPRRLEALLNRNAPPRWEVLNFGVQGHGTVDSFLLYSMYAAQFDPDIVLLGFFLNDAMDGAETIRRNEEWTADWPISALSHISRISELIERSRIAARMQADYFEAIRRSIDSPRWETCRRAMRDLQRLTRERGARFEVIVFPVLWGLESDYPFEDMHGRIREACREDGIACLDLLEAFKGRAAADLWVHPTDHHPNAEGQRIAAEAIARRLGRY